MFITKNLTFISAPKEITKRVGSSDHLLIEATIRNEGYINISKKRIFSSASINDNKNILAISE